MAEESSRLGPRGTSEAPIVAMGGRGENVSSPDGDRGCRDHRREKEFVEAMSAFNTVWFRGESVGRGSRTVEGHDVGG